MATLRHAIIGVGASILGGHRPGLELDTAELVGVTDVNQEIGSARAEELGVPFFADHHALLAEAKPDVVVILAPHPFHASLTIDALDAGAHVLVEKPMAVRASEADAMVEAAERNGKLLAINFQHRTRGDIRAIQQLIQSGELGKLQHVDMVAAWPRTAKYYAGGGWRGTWKGEGGGVLMNQAPHNLDLICHLFGLPARVFAWTRTVLHNIETEDTVHAICEWPNGMLGSLHITTAEAGRSERFEIVGSAGSVQIIDSELTHRRLSPDFAEIAKTSDEAMPKLSADDVAIKPLDGEGNHREIYRNLHDAIQNGTALVADGASGRQSLELANALILSSHTGAPVELPLSRQAYDELFSKLAGQSA
ncbi:dehydrogenase [Devosia pacifica]|uniref:Dehydrogenase n=1 Tax=Devosia pacifica TaxID=1335967 RepID=A0A918RUB0_9HYPH|nr:Gfo/Idh/MocA family oxidoreductase [Devosia pacifica]GHA13061.1 dehydrogenase [Devosia pacifica]